MLERKVGDCVQNGDVLAYVHANTEASLNDAVHKMQDIIKITDMPKEKNNSILLNMQQFY